MDFGPRISVTESDVALAAKSIFELSSPIHIEILVTANVGLRDFCVSDPTATLRDLGANGDHASGYW